MGKRITGHFLCVFLGLFHALWAVDVLDDRPLSQLLHNNWRYGDELPLNRITDIEVSKSGYLWLASYDGLFRFDGYEFREYGKEDFDALAGGCRSLYITDNNTIWIGGNGNGLFRYEKGEFVNWNTADGLEYSGYYRLFSDLENRVVLPGKKGLQTIVDDKVVAYPLPGCEEFWIREVCFLDDGSVYAGLWEGGLICFSRSEDGSYLVNEVELPEGIDGKTRALGTDPEGNLWIGLDIGVILKLDSKGNFDVFNLDGSPDLDTTWHFEIDDTGVLWASYDRGLLRIDQNGYQTIKPDSMADQDTIVDIAFTADGSLFCSGYSSGLHLFTLPKLPFFTQRDGLSAPMVNCVEVGRDGEMYVGTQSGVDIYEDGGFRPFHPELFQGKLIRDIFRDSKDRLWVCVLRHALVCLDGDNVFTYSKDDGFPSNRVRVVAESADGSIWVGTQDGLVRIYEDGRMQVFNDRNGLGNNYVLSVFVDTQDRVWVGTAGGGLIKIEDDELTEVTIGSAAESSVIFACSELKDGRLLFGWVGGVVLVHPDLTVETFSTAEKGDAEAVFGVFQDSLGDFWIPGNRSVQYVKEREFLSYLERGFQNLVFQDFDSKNALPSKLIRANARTVLDRKGRLWIPLGNGISLGDSRSIVDYSEAPIVNIHTVLVDHKDLYQYDSNSFRELVLDPGMHTLHIQYSGVSFESRSNVLYRIRMKGFEDWIETTRREAIYTNLKPKSYQFEVMCCNLDGVWTTVPEQLSVTIKPYFYQWQLFWFFVVLVLIGIVWGIFYLRTIHLRERSILLQKLVEERTEELKLQNELIQEKNRKLTNTSRDLTASVSALKNANENKNKLLSVTAHDLKNSVAAIVSSSDMLEQGMDEKVSTNSSAWKDEKMLVQMISSTGNDLLATIQQMLNKEARELESFKLHPEYRALNEIVDSVVALNGTSAIEKDQRLVIVENVELEAWIDPLHIRMAIDNYVSNAIKYSPEGAFIEIALRLVERDAVSYMRFSVKDEGPGLTDEDKTKVFGRFTRLSAQPTGKELSSGIGLSIVKDIVESHHGKVGVDSVLGQGATFFFEVPLKESV